LQGGSELAGVFMEEGEAVKEKKTKLLTARGFMCTFLPDSMAGRASIVAGAGISAAM